MLEGSISGYCRTITCGLTRGSFKLLIIIAMILSISAVFAANSAQAATVETDKLDYAPGETVVVTGSGWQAAETVTLLFHEVPTLSADVTIYATADDAGNIAALYTIEPQDAGVTYTLTATGNSSALTAQAIFTDKPAANLDQCANGSDGTIACNDALNSGWQNGNLNHNQAQYFEGDSVPYRARVTGLTVGNTYTVNIEWDTTKSSKHAEDYLTSFNRTVAANPCSSVASVPAGACASPSFTPIPGDPLVATSGVTQIPGNFTIYNGSITGVSAYTDPANYTGDTSTSIVLTFTPNADGTVVIAWGGHISTRLDWGLNNSAVTISGSPYHMRLIDFTCTETGCGVGNQDRSLDSEAVIFPGSIKIEKDAIPDNAQDFAFTTTGPDLSGFTLDDDADPTLSNTRLFSNIITFGSGNTRTVTESSVSGWDVSSIQCTVDTGTNHNSWDTSTRTATIILDEGQNVTCTFTNSRQQAHLIVIKHVVNDNGGTATAGDFTMTVTGTNPNPSSFAGAESPGTNVTLDPDTAYGVSESGPSSYTETDSTDCSSSTGIAAGETKTCTVTNDDQAAHLIVIKHVINDNGGTKSASDFTMTINSVTAQGGNSFAGQESPGTNKTLTTVGSYSVTEGNLPSYSSSSSADCSGTIALGETKTCTITNDDQSGKLIVIKHVINDNGGTAVAGDFTMSVTGGSPSPASFPGAESPGTNVNLNAGSYSVGESGPSGYARSDSADCSGTIALGETKTCTVTNNDVQPKLIVIKHVINDNAGTAVAGDFTMSVTGGGPSPASFPGAESPGTTVNLNAGSYSVGESGPSGYARSDSADCSGTITVGQTKTCTVTNNDVQPKLIVIKHVINDNGGTATAGDFTMSVTGSSPSPASFPGAGSPGTNVNLDAGSYSVGESGPGGYARSDSADCSGTIAVGQTKTCTVTNNDIAPKLTVTKIVVNDNGGTKQVSDFPLFVDGNPVTSGVQNTVNAGNHTVSETGQSGYSAAITGDCDASGKVTLNPGDVKACTITNDDVAPKLTVTKVVINDNGGTKQVSDFPLFVDGGSVTSGVQNTFNAGNHTVSETGQPGYAATISGDCDSAGKVTLNPGDAKSCTITNNDIAPKLTVTKIVINDNGGTKQVSDFPLFVDGGSVTSGVQNTFNAGNHVVSETGQPGYSASISGNCDASGNVTLNVGDVKSCIITNNDVPATLIVNKVCTPSNDTGKFNLQIDGVTKAADAGCGGSTGGVPVNAGTHIVGETAGTGTSLSDYVATINSSCASNGSITLTIGQVASCTITNVKKGMAKVTKTVKGVPPSATQSFTFQIRQGATATAAGTMLEQGNADSTNGGVINFTTKLIPGSTYQLCETVMPGWMTTLGPPFFVVFNPSGDNSTVCTDFTVAAGETKNFAIDNSPPPGGLARTIGFWKNWSSCTGGGQKPVLDQTLSASEPAGITIGILTLHGSTSNPTVSPDCLKATRILDKSTIDTGKKMSSDPAFNLAAQLLGAKLNVQAGAGVCPAAVQAINDAQALLAAIHFNGKTHDKMTAAQNTQANSLATTLDKYNNNKLC